MKVNTILDSIDNGAIALPEFQRGYVWNRPQVRGLMDSLYRGHPVGSLLTWQTRTEHADARGEAALQPGTVQLLLDGQQRITTLYGLVRGKAPAFFDGNAQAFTDLRFHLDDQVFEFWQPVKMRDDSRWIDVSDLFRRGAGDAIGELWERARDHSAEDVLGAWMERLNRVDQIKERDFHIELVTGEDKTVDVVVEIFNRVNSGGTKLSKGDLALAKICAEWPQAREELKERLAKWRVAGFEFSLDLLLRVVNAIVTGRAPFSALSEVEPDAIRGGLQRAEEAIDRILNTLASRLGLDHGTVLPAVYPFVVMARYLATHEMSFGDHGERDRLLYWYVQASMWGRYAGSTETVLAQDLTALATGADDPVERLIANLRRQRGDLTVRPADFRAWSRGARFFPILYMLTRADGARDWGTGEALDRHALGRYSDLEVHHIFPKRVLYDAGYARPDVNSIANFTFLSLETNRAISDRDPVDYLPEYMARQPGAVESHWMPIEADLWTTDKYPDFLERRRVLLAAAANSFFSRLHDGHLAPAADQPAEPPAGTSIGHVPVEESEEEQLIREVRAWIASRGFDDGELAHELIAADGESIAVLDAAWPHGLQRDLSEPVALLIDEPAEVFFAAVGHGYRPFTTAESLRQYVLDLEATGLDAGDVAA